MYTKWIYSNETCKKITFSKEYLLVEGLCKNEFFYFKDVRRFETFKDVFFYGKTLGINVYFRNGSLKKST